MRDETLRQHARDADPNSVAVVRALNDLDRYGLLSRGATIVLDGARTTRAIGKLRQRRYHDDFLRHYVRSRAASGLSLPVQWISLR